MLRRLSKAGSGRGRSQFETPFCRDCTMQKTSPPGPMPLQSEIEQQVARVLNHRSFSRSVGPARLLKYLLSQLAENGGQPASQRQLATVLGLPADFDPVSNPLVRMHMSKLRKMLSRYASGDGRTDPIKLEIPRNQYRIMAVLNGEAAARLEEDHPPQKDCRSQRPVVLICEFSCEAGCRDGLASELAFRLVAMLAESTQIAAIGPGLRSRLDAEDLTILDFAERCRARFALDGQLLPGLRGLELVTRVLDVPSGDVCWSDWLDEPMDRFDADHSDSDDASLLASRVVDKLSRFDALRAVGQPANR
jgi:TolB-like protein